MLKDPIIIKEAVLERKYKDIKTNSNILKESCFKLTFHAANKKVGISLNYSLKIVERKFCLKQIVIII